MNGLNRFILVITGIVGLVSVVVLLLGIYDVPRLSPYWERWQNQEEYVYTVLALSIFLGVVFLIMLVTGLVAKSNTGRYTIQTGEGRITISTETIEKMVYESLKPFQGVRAPDVKVDIDSKRDSVRVHIDCSVFNRQGLPTLGKEIQTHVKERLESLLEVPVTDVSLNIQDTKRQTSERVV